jgi:molybdate/tungstate transport system substrate-binding protein
MLSRSVVVVIVVLITAGMTAVGFVAGYEYRGSPASSPQVTTNSTLSILGAGTLDTLFPEVASELVNETPGISAPAATQTYEGSLDITTAITTLHTPADVAAVADYRLIPSLLESTYAAYEVVFGATQEVLAYNPSLAVFHGINESNWAEKLVQDVTSGNKPMAIWNASTDPNGYNEIFSLMLQGLLYNGSASTFYDPLYSGGATSPAVGNPSRTILEHESGAATDLNTGVVSALITYRSYAVVNHLAYQPFNPIVGLGANNSTALADYAMLSTMIFGGSPGTFETVHPAPVLFSVTVPSTAPNPALGAAFIHLLLSPQGGAILSYGGAFAPIFPGWVDHERAVPSVLAPDVVPLPAWASALLG